MNPNHKRVCRTLTESIFFCLARIQRLFVRVSLKERNTLSHVYYYVRMRPRRSQKRGSGRTYLFGPTTNCIPASLFACQLVYFGDLRVKPTLFRPVQIETGSPEYVQWCGVSYLSDSVRKTSMNQKFGTDDERTSEPPDVNPTSPHCFVFFFIIFSVLQSKPSEYFATALLLTHLIREQHPQRHSYLPLGAASHTLLFIGRERASCSLDKSRKRRTPRADDSSFAHTQKTVE